METNTTGSEPEFWSGRPKPFVFTGSAREYFGIWVVNLALSVLTLGVYSAWAKVRRLQYFYRHTRLEGVPFDYHGTPIAILKGRIIAANLLLVYTLAGQLGPVFSLVAFGVLALALPWLLMRSMIFRLHNTSYRGLRFQFAGSLAGSYGVFVCLPVLSVFTVFLLFPYCHHRIKRYQFANARYGATPFTYHGRASHFYRTYLRAVGLILAISLVAGICLGLAAVVIVSRTGAPPPPVATVLLGFLFYGAVALAFRAYIDTRVRNYVWQHARLGDRRVYCDMTASSLFFLRATNIAAILLTFGLFLPFAQIRTARYMASVLSLTGRSFDELAGADEQQADATGDEAVGMFDFDIAM